MTEQKYRILFDEGEGEGEGTGEGAGAGEGAGGTPPTMPEGAFMASDFSPALPEDLRANPTIAKYGGNLEEMARGVIHATSLHGRDPSTLMVRPDLSNAESVRDTYRALGVPETFEADAYKLEAGEGTPEFLSPDKDMAKGFTEAAHAANLTPAQTQAVYGWFTGAMAESDKAVGAATDQSNSDQVIILEKAWGKEGTPGFKQQVAAAEFAVDAIGKQADGTNPFREAINQTNLGMNAAFMQGLAKMGAKFGEDDVTGTVDVAAGRFGDAKSPDQLNSEAQSLLQKAADTKDIMEAKRLNEQAQVLFAQRRKLMGEAA